MKARVQGRNCPPARQRGDNFVFQRKLVQKQRFWGAPGPRQRHQQKREQEYDAGGAQLYEWGVGPGGKDAGGVQLYEWGVGPGGKSRSKL